MGTGCSLGVDSLSVIKKYLLDKDCLPDYRITHFTCFNVGAFGLYNTEGMRATFRKEVSFLKNFASGFGIPVVSVDTNIREFYPERNFNWSHSFLNMGCVLSLQKLFGKYLYASGYSVDNFKFDIHDTAYYEGFLLPNLSTESTELISADMEKTRSDKVKYIMDEPLSQKHINVCLKSQYINDGKMQQHEDKGYRNCGYCEKCLRTMLQLDIFGRLQDYSDSFNLTDWEERKKTYLAKVIAGRRENLMYADIYRTIPSDYNGFREIERIVNRPWLFKKTYAILSRVRHLFK